MTTDGGTFTLSDVPPGEYTLMAWHPALGTMLQKKVTVTEKGTSTVDFAFEAPKGRRSVHEIETNPHYGPESLGKVVDIRPTLERQVP
ncbi:MAG: carboxypeptidase-like regulatory domain-containing protein [Nitrospira sp.]